MTSPMAFMTSSNTCGGFWEVVVAHVAHVACSGGPRRPNVFLQEVNFALEGVNFTLKGHGVLIFA
jgi:hypothetical protein